MFICQKFHNTESRMCFLIWIFAVLYAIYKFTRASQHYFYLYSDHYEDFESGWPILGFLNRDKADFEWETIRYFIKTIFPSLLTYSISSQIIKHWMPQMQVYSHYFQVISSLLYLTYLMGYRITAVALLQPILFYIISQTGHKLFIWVCNLCCLSLIAVFKNLCTFEKFLEYMELDHFKAYLCVLLLCWMNLKCTSFFLIHVPGTKPNLMYCFNPSTLFVGPFLNQSNFNVKEQSMHLKLKKLMLDLVRCMFWGIFLDFSLHFIYVNATMFQLELVKQLDLWALCGYGYLMGQFFHIKYIVQYGLSTSLAAFDGMTVPRLPRCIGRVHLYSDMWKYFDPGLYNFLKMFIYVPSLKIGLNKFGASLLCFGFVYLWHGTQQFIFIWALLNFLGVTLEAAFATLYTSKLSKLRSLKGKNTKRRMKNLLAAPLLAMSAISNFYFFAGKEIGDIFINKFLGESLLNQTLLIAILYCCCEVSTELQDIESAKMGV